jgi:hypothetical protein
MTAPLETPALDVQRTQQSALCASGPVCKSERTFPGGFRARSTRTSTLAVLDEDVHCARGDEQHGDDREHGFGGHQGFGRARQR